MARHILERNGEIGFADRKSPVHLEPNIVDPTAAQNDACVVAIK